MKKKLLATLLIAAMTASTIAGCSSSSSTSSSDSAAEEETEEAEEEEEADEAEEEADVTPDKTYDLTVATIDGSSYAVPIWYGMENGIFEKYGVNLDLTTFTNGMVLMEAIDTWDIAQTGIGGILSGMINYDAKLVSVLGTDTGTQSIFVRPDSDIVEAGTGNNTHGDNIYGDAESWKGKEVLCTQGGVLHYLLIQTLDGFGLTMDDVDVTWMDMATSNASFLTGEGDAACVTGAVSFSEDKDDYVRAVIGSDADLGISSAAVANPDAYADADKYAGMKQFMKAYYECVDYLLANEADAEQYMIDWCEYCGIQCDEASAKIFLQADPNYNLEQCYDVMHEEPEDSTYTCKFMEQQAKILSFYIDCGTYADGDLEKLLADGKYDTQLIDEIYDEQ